jgi:hypothetical protein
MNLLSLKKRHKFWQVAAKCFPISPVVSAWLLYFLQILVWIQHKAFVDLKMFRFFISNLV